MSTNLFAAIYAINHLNQSHFAISPEKFIIKEIFLLVFNIIALFAFRLIGFKMIAKIVKGQGFKGVVNYILDQTKNTELLNSEGVRFDKSEYHH